MPFGPPLPNEHNIYLYTHIVLGHPRQPSLRLFVLQLRGFLWMRPWRVQVSSLLPVILAMTYRYISVHQVLNASPSNVVSLSEIRWHMTEL